MDILRPFCRDISKYELTEYSGGAKFRNGDTIMARITPCLENGKIAKVNILYDNEVGFGSTEYIVFRAKEGVTDENFVYYLVCSPLIRDPAIKSMVGSSGRQRVQTDVIKNLEVSVPDIVTQRRIGSLLKSIDDKIAINTKINENLEQQAQAILKSWFVDFEPFGGKMPDNWNECILDSICSLIIKGITPKYVDQSDQLVINQKCVRFIPNNLTVDSHVTIIRASKKEYLYYLGLWATSHEHDFEMLQTGSTGQTDLPRERLKQMPIILPSKDILCKFSEVIKPIADIKIKNQQENQHLTVLRNTLLPKLMNGEIDVSKVQI